jgi:hypothetical protein
MRTTSPREENNGTRFVACVKSRHTRGAGRSRRFAMSRAKAPARVAAERFCGAGMRPCTMFERFNDPSSATAATGRAVATATARPPFAATYGYTAPGADSPCPAFRNNDADPTNSMKKNAFPPNPRHTAADQEVTGGF